jgi:hypothetical protein
MECEIPQFYQATEQIARKEYDCCECSAKIKTGEMYLKAVGKWDGRFDQWRQHLLCARACEFVRDKDWNDGCVGFGMLFEWIHDEAYDLKDFRRNDPEARQFRDMIAKIKWRERNG